MQTVSETDGRKVIKTPEQKRERKRERINETLRRWDLLPDDAIIRVAVLAALEDCSIPTVWRRTKAQIYPAPIKLSSQATGWTVGSIRAMRAKRLAKAAA
jgi:predicted DNA-binding transcriptional regulator AlpA